MVSSQEDRGAVTTYAKKAQVQLVPFVFAKKDTTVAFPEDALAFHLLKNKLNN